MVSRFYLATLWPRILLCFRCNCLAFWLSEHKRTLGLHDMDEESDFAEGRGHDIIEIETGPGLFNMASGLESLL